MSTIAASPDSSSTPIRLADHADALAANIEVHARPVRSVPPETMVRRITAAYPGARDDGRATCERFIAWARAEGIDLVHHSERHLGFSRAGIAVTLELHTEFISLTWWTALDWADPLPALIGWHLLADLEIMVRLSITTTNQPVVDPGDLARLDPLSLCYSSVDEGRARLATDFRTDESGFTHYILATSGCSDLRRGTMIRRLLEIETYRIMAVMGLPMARRAVPVLNAMEADLDDVLAAMAGNRAIDDHRVTLDRLSTIAQQAERQAADTSHRFDASRAYAEILDRRIARMAEQPIDDYTTIARFLTNRVGPALSTCTAVEKRQVAILARTMRTTELLSTRIELDLQLQNKQLLDSIASTARNQYRLQTTIESISTIALSYYCLGILSYFLSPLHFPEPLSKGIVLAMLAPLVLLVVYLGVRRLRHRHHKT